MRRWPLLGPTPPLLSSPAPAVCRSPRRWLVRPRGVLGPLELHLESFHAHLKAVHGLYGRLRRCRVVETDEPCRTPGRQDGSAGVLDNHHGGDKSKINVLTYIHTYIVGAPVPF